MDTLVWTMTRMIVIMGERGRERGRVGKDRIMGRRDRKKKNSLSWRKNLSFVNIPQGKYHHVMDKETMAQTTGQGKSRTAIQASRLVSSWF